MSESSDLILRIIPQTSLYSDDTTSDFRKRQLGILTCNDQVAIEDDFHASTVCAAIHGGDDGLGRC